MSLELSTLNLGILAGEATAVCRGARPTARKNPHLLKYFRRWEIWRPPARPLDRQITDLTGHRTAPRPTDRPTDQPTARSPNQPTTRPPARPQDNRPNWTPGSPLRRPTRPTERPTDRPTDQQTDRLDFRLRGVKLCNCQRIQAVANIGDQSFDGLVWGQ